MHGVYARGNIAFQPLHELPVQRAERVAVQNALFQRRPLLGIFLSVYQFFQGKSNKKPMRRRIGKASVI
jgi:hypothetical protein